MSRRRKKNPLLGRILVISVVAHAIALPILAQFGVFDKVKKQLQYAEVVLVDAPKDAEEKAAPVKKEKAASRKSSSTPSNAPPNPNAPKIVTSSTPGEGGGDGGPALESGTGKAGVAPTPPAPQPEPKPQPVVTPKPVAERVMEAPTPKPAPPTPKHVPSYKDAEQTYAPAPVIPEDLRQEALDKTFVADFTVGSDGVPTEVKMAQSTGIKELDEVALAAAKLWRFKPATMDGQGVSSKVQLRIEFTVETL